MTDRQPADLRRLQDRAPACRGRHRAPAGTRQDGLGPLFDLLLPDQAGEVGQVICVGRAAEHDLDDRRVPDRSGGLASPAVAAWESDWSTARVVMPDPPPSLTSDGRDGSG